MRAGALSAKFLREQTDPIMTHLLRSLSTTLPRAQVSPYLRTFRMTMSGTASHTNGQRTFPPLYKSNGNESADRLAFFHILERLKVHLPISSQHPSFIGTVSRLRSVRVG